MRIDVSRKDVHRSVKRCVQYEVRTSTTNGTTQSCPVVKMGEFYHVILKLGMALIGI